MIRPPRSTSLRYAGAVVAVAFAAWLRLGLGLAESKQPPFAAFYLAVIFTAWFGGLGPSVMALVLSTLASALFFAIYVAPTQAIDLDTMIGMVLFFTACVSIIAISQANRAARRRLERNVDEHERDKATIAEQVRLAEFGREVGLALTRSATLPEMLTRCVEVTVGRLEGAFARIWTVNESGDMLELQASAGIYTHIDGLHARIRIGQYKIGLIAQDRKPHLTNSVIGDPRIPAQEWAAEQGIVAFAGYPLIVDERLVGVLAMFARRALSPTTLEMMEAVANEVALGIERKRTEERLHRQREWLRVTLESIGDAVIATDNRGRVTFLNAVAESLTGRSQDEAAGRPLQDVFRIADELTGKPVEIPALRAFEKGRAAGLSHRSVLIGEDGRGRAIDDCSAPIRDESGAIIGAVLIFRDVEERRRSERALEASEARKAAVLQTALDAIITIDHESKVVEWNPAAEKIFGYESAAVIGRAMTELIVPPAWREFHCRGIAHYFETGEAPILGHRLEIEAIRSDGTEIPVELAITSISSNGPPLFTAHVRDITERRRAEDEQRRAAEELTLAKEAAEQANGAKDQFLAVLSHELRTPLNPILLAATAMLERPTEPEELRPTLEMIRQNVNLQARLIDDLLDVMRIARGKMPLHWEVADCHRVIDQAIQICRGEISDKARLLVVHLDAGLHHVNADPARLQQVFWNLIKNAAKFTPGSGTITIRTRNQEMPNEGETSIAIEVCDTGIGIEPELQPRIFDPFQQGETTITRKFGGLGLGLAICRGIVEAHGGVLTAESMGKDHGTTFRVVLKALPSSAVDGDARPPAGVRADATGDPSTLHILVVEDDPTTLRLMARLLRNPGHEVETAMTIDSALAVFEAGTFDLVVSDIGLPDGSGLDLMRRIVALRGPIPAIALTGYGMEDDIRRSREAGFTAHLTKPIDFTKLESMIRQIAPAHA